MVRNNLSKFFVVLLLTSAQAWATTDDSSSSSASVDSTNTSTESLEKLIGNRQFQDTHTLTDPSLRTSDGSLSQYSIKGSFAYSGPTLGDLSAQNQPNPDGTAGNYAQHLTGSLTGNFRFSPTQSLSAGTGIGLNYPFLGQNQYYTNNPFIAYNLASRWDDLQMRNSGEVIKSTVANYTSVGETSGAEWFNGLVYNLNTKVALSLDTTFYYWFFSRGYTQADGFAGKKAQIVQQYSLGMNPGAKWNFTDNMNIYGNLAFQWYNPRGPQQDGGATLWSRQASMSLGYGWAYSRDIYISPYLVAYPKSIGTDETTVNLSTTFSLL